MRFGYSLRKMVLRRLIWVCTVCQLPFQGFPDDNGILNLLRVFSAFHVFFEAFVDVFFFFFFFFFFVDIFFFFFFFFIFIIIDSNIYISIL